MSVYCGSTIPEGDLNKATIKGMGGCVRKAHFTQRVTLSVCAALALEGGDSVRLGQTLPDGADGQRHREGFAALQSLGVRVMPFNLKLIFSWMPRWFAVRYWQRALQTDVGTLAIAPHANAAPEEMSRVARQILVFLEPSPRPVPTLKRLLVALMETAPALQPLQE